MMPLIGKALDLISNPKWSRKTCALILALEVLLNVLIIWKVRYTELDWKAYMQEVGGFLNGTLDYDQLKGDTGPLVYPAGFVYLFSVLYFMTDAGESILLAQCVFAVLYLIVLALVFYIYLESTSAPPIVYVLMSLTSYRVHSIFVLRLFNDPVAMLFLYAAVACFLNERWTLGCLLYSFSISIKMNTLLFSPALAVVLLYRFGVLGAIRQIVLCAFLQLVLGLPFLIVSPVAYVRRSFDLGRVFFFKWTVNWRFLPEWLFLSPWFHVSLLALHVIALVSFAAAAWPPARQALRRLMFKPGETKIAVSTTLTKSDLVFMMFTSNLLGVAFARSLHYQFYVWYYHTIPWLLLRTPYNAVVAMALWMAIELCWNTFPSTVISGICLHVCHSLIIAGLLIHTRQLIPRKDA